MEGETVYGSQDDPSQGVMSERVQTLARNIYQEFQRMIQKYDEDVVKDLMPNIVNMLECMDLTYTANQEHEVELELIREDNEQLVTQYEREKQLRRTAESKLLELEDMSEEEHQGLQAKVESLESIVRMLELKAKNASDHVFRLEEKENEMRREFTKVHDRYTELLKVHMDHVERTRVLLGAERLDAGVNGRPSNVGGGLNSWSLSLNLTPPNASRSTGPLSFGFSSLENSGSHGANNGKFFAANPVAELAVAGAPPPQALSTELLGAAQPPPTTLAESPPTTSSSSAAAASAKPRSVWSSPAAKEDDVLKKFDDVTSHMQEGKSLKRKEERSANTLYQELSFQDSIAEDADITGNWVHPGEFASSVTDNFYGMGKEVENLITENNELLATKNALNIVKDDLIAKVDELSSEQEILRDEIRSLHQMRNRLRLRTDELEAECKMLREEIDSVRKAAKSEDEQEDVPLSQRKRFTRVEMARVLMERNQYKERWMELQEAVRWTEMLRAQKAAGQQEETDKRQRQSVWKFFSNLFTPSPPSSSLAGPAQGAAPLMRQSQTVPSLQFHVQSGKLAPVAAGRHRRSDPVPAKMEVDSPVRAHVRRQDGRLQAYGWSLPSRPPGSASSAASSATSSSSAAAAGAGAPAPASTASPAAKGHAGVATSVPVPVYCRPLEDQEAGMKVWCAAGIDLTGGFTKDGRSMVGSSVFYNVPTGGRTPHDVELGQDAAADAADEVQSLAAELAESQWHRADAERSERRLSSLVWIVSSANGKSRVNVVDSNRPGDVILTFDVPAVNVLCIASVSGVKDSDYPPPGDESPAAAAAAAATSTGSGRQSDDADVDPTSPQAPPPATADATQPDGEPSQESQPASHIGSIRYVSCSVAGCDPLDQPVQDHDVDVFQPTLSKKRTSPAPEEAEVATDAISDGPSRSSRSWKISPWSDVIKDGVSEPGENLTRASTAQATVWMGCQCGRLYIHSAVLHWKKPLHVVKLPDAVLSIIHVRGRVLAALANGQVALFCRRPADAEWDVAWHWLLELAPPTVAVRCLTRVHGTVWASFRNKIAVIDPNAMRVEECFEAHPRKESQVRQLCWAGDGVWISIRLDSSIRLFHAHNYRHLQDVDVEPYVSKMLGTGKLGFSFVRITSMMISLQRLWMGTGNGVIISVPLSTEAAPPRPGLTGVGVAKELLTSVTASSTAAAAAASSSTAGDDDEDVDDDVRAEPSASAGLLRPAAVYSDQRDRLVAGSFIPYCSMAQAQLSFHGHKDAVKFFVAVPGQGGISAASGAAATEEAAAATAASETHPAASGAGPSSMLVLSGGEGYVDFRQEPDELQETASHLIVWHVTVPAGLVDAWPA